MPCSIDVTLAVQLDTRSLLTKHPLILWSPLFYFSITVSLVGPLLFIP